METKFNSQTCTSQEQSKRLLALGLKKETADMVHNAIYRGTKVVGYRVAYGYNHKHFEIFANDIPAWSLHRLLCLYGADYTIKEVYNNAEECYGMLICAIEIAIEDGDFNEEYLEKQWE